MYPSYRGGFGDGRYPTHEFSGYQPRGRGRGSFPPVNQRGNFQYRGGNFGRPPMPPRPRGSYSQPHRMPHSGHQRFNRPAYNTFTNRNTDAKNVPRPLNETGQFAEASGRQKSESTTISTERNYYEYDEEPSTVESKQGLYEEVPEYRQSSEMTEYDYDTQAGMKDPTVPSENDQTQLRSSLPGDDIEDQENTDQCPSNEKQDGDHESDEDYSFCKYCNVSFQTFGAYQAHIRGVQHTTNYMEQKERLKEAESGMEHEEDKSSHLTSQTGHETEHTSYHTDQQSHQTDQSSNQTDQFSCQTDQSSYETEQSSSQTGQASHHEDSSNQKTEPSQTVTEQEQQDNDDSSSDSDDDTGYCKYCKTNFATTKAFHTHTRGLQHITLVMEAKAAKGDKRFQKEIVPPEALEVVVPKPKEPEEETANAFEIEDNWMDLDDELISYIKDKKNIKDKDLHPKEIGKKINEEFACPLCEIQCTGPAAFKCHLEGKSHKVKMQQAEQGVLIRKKKAEPVMVTVPSKGRPSKLSSMIENLSAPMLGLEYVTEFQKPDLKEMAKYVCNLCESKMDEFAIVPHLIGSKHRLKYMKIADEQLYTHLTKYSSKKKKSELNASCEEFAIELEEKKGRREVKVKIEIGEETGKADLEDSMLKASKELREKVHALMERNAAKEAEDQEPVAKKGKYSGSQFSRAADLDDRGRDPVERDYRELERDRFRGRERDWSHVRGRQWDRTREWEWERDHMRDRDRYFERERGRFHDYRRAEYDIMDDRRLYDERRYLDSQLLDRYRLDDPYEERRRIQDIYTRREHIESLEQQRIDRFMERRKQIEESDPDLLRLKRFSDRPVATIAKAPEPPVPQQPDTEDVNYRPSMEELMARRRQNRDIVDRLQERPKVQDMPQCTDLGTANVREESLAEKVLATKSVQEEVAKNPGVNVSELLSKLSSSMIGSEDEAAMALQISNALSHALLTYRLQQSTSMPLVTNSSAEAEIPVESSIPGFDNGTTTSANETNVPSFLKTRVSSALSTADTQPSGLAALSAYVDPATQTGQLASYPPPAPQTSLAASYAVQDMQTGSQGYYAQTGPQVSYVPSDTQTGAQVLYQQNAQSESHVSSIQPDTQAYQQASSVLPNTQTGLQDYYLLSNTQTGQQASHMLPNTQTGIPPSYESPYLQTGQHASYVLPNNTQTSTQVSYMSPYSQSVQQVSYVSPTSQTSTQVSYVSPHSQTGQQVFHGSVYTQADTQVSYMSPNTHISNVASNTQTGTQVSYVSPNTQTSTHVSYMSPNTQTNSKSLNQTSASKYVSTSKSIGSFIKNTDQPQRDILESIRKQTEMLRKKIQQATSGASPPLPAQHPPLPVQPPPPRPKPPKQ